MSALLVTEYTDAACPWAWSAEPAKWRLRWLYGDGLRWRLRQIVLAHDADELAQKGLTREYLAEAYAGFAERYGMPFDLAVRPRLAATAPAARAVVAVRLHAPELEERLLRRLRVQAMATPTGLMDDPLTLARAARETGIEPALLERWTASEAVERQLEADMDDARTPTPQAIALKHKLAPVPDGWRYTAPSLVFTREDGATIDVPGFQPSLAYEVAVANLVPDLPRREAPASVRELLAWAGEPLATAEVAEVLGISAAEARLALSAEADAIEQPLGTDAFWTLQTQPALLAA